MPDSNMEQPRESRCAKNAPLRINIYIVYKLIQTALPKTAVAIAL